MNLQVDIGEDDDMIRHDTHSHEVTMVYPNLPLTSRWNLHREFVKKRLEYIHERDMEAYHHLKHHCNIDFVPTSYPKT